ncbi:MAG: S1/P1 nuclease [Bryobacterales bacterium]|nr:S1/P1 nuclease [Bryobacterales bacterium]
MRRFMAVAVWMALCAPVWAWHPVGHRIIAAMAYDQLSGKTRARVDELIRRHPDYAKFTEGVKGNARQTARWAFIHAAAWGDDIKGDSRFYDDTRRDAKPTRTLPPFPDMRRHTNWHYVNVYFSPDGVRLPKSPVPSAKTELPKMIAGLEGELGWYHLVWLLHVEGDVHQPLHCTARLTNHLLDRSGKPASDLGGNLVVVDGYTNLHTVWDDLLGVTRDEVYIDWMAKRLKKEHRKPAELSLDPNVWIEEGSAVAQMKAYVMPAGVGTRENPFRRTPAYEAESLAVAHQRAALAAYRLAAVLSSKLP